MRHVREANLSPAKICTPHLASSEGNSSASGIHCKKATHHGMSHLFNSLHANRSDSDYTLATTVQACAIAAAVRTSANESAHGERLLDQDTTGFGDSKRNCYVSMHHSDSHMSGDWVELRPPSVDGGPGNYQSKGIYQFIAQTST